MSNFNDPELMQRAFDLVNPRALAEQAFARGEIKQADLDQISWKDEIDHVVTDAILTQANVTLAQVVDAIIYRTGDVPQVRSDKHKGIHHIIGSGYRMGPCGDY